MIDPPEVTIVDSARVKCDGAQQIPGGVAFGHPRVWLEIDEKGYVDCGYCDRRFVLRDGAAHRGLHEVSPGDLFPEDVAEG